MKKDQSGAFLCAVFVDYDNIYMSLKRKSEEAAKRFAKDAGHWIKAIETGALITPTNGIKLEGQRRIVMNRCYGNPVPRRNTTDNSTDMNSFPFVRHHFLRAGFEIIDCPPLTAQLKNSSDIRMVMDIRDYLTHPTHFDEFIILSGDADFTPVLHRLRAHARRTVIFANDYTAAPYTAISDGEVRESDLVNLLLESTATQTGAAAGENAAEAARRDILADVVATVRGAAQPVPLEVLADRAVRVIGHERTIGTSWGGAGGFRELLAQGLPEDLKLSGEPPYVVIDSKRHAQAEPVPVALVAQAAPAASLAPAPQPIALTAQPLPVIATAAPIVAQPTVAQPAIAIQPAAAAQVIAPQPQPQTAYAQAAVAQMPLAQAPVTPAPIAQAPMVQAPIAQAPIAQAAAPQPTAYAQTAEPQAGEPRLERQPAAPAAAGTIPAQAAPQRDAGFFGMRGPAARATPAAEAKAVAPAQRAPATPGYATPAPAAQHAEPPVAPRARVSDYGGYQQAPQAQAPQVQAPSRGASARSAEPAAEPRGGDAPSTIQQSIARIHDACQAPPLAPPEYRMLFEVMAQEINENGLIGAQTILNITRRAQERGVDLRRDDVRFVLDVVGEADPWFEQGASANLFAGRFRNFVVARCRGQGLNLSADELDLVEAWFAGSGPSAAQPAARPEPRQTYEPRPEAQPRQTYEPRSEPRPSYDTRQAPEPRQTYEPRPGYAATTERAAAPRATQQPQPERGGWSLDEGRQQYMSEGRGPARGATPTQPAPEAQGDEFPRIVRTRLRG